ncbi:hypothetical protein CHX27_11050 [Flavobacterium aurantiibacter]|uniref:Uncharacterized protein n=1 Tax=Flavobacterium aurantiibacter TaxID=2023067 RepID=A0A255ZNT6_9FLAO|nr:hypothetical protein CHX27_11050 [Flavobacterium aurantiibacter]
MGSYPAFRVKLRYISCVWLHCGSSFLGRSATVSRTATALAKAFAAIRAARERQIKIVSK